VLQNNPVPNRALEDQLKSLVESEGEKVAKICRLIHTTSGLLSETPVCRDWDYVLQMARTIVLSHRPEESKAQGSEPFDEDMYLLLVNTESERAAEISRQIYDACALSSDVDWNFLVDNARWIISPHMGIESEAQANVVIGYRGVYLEEN
jgi:hypothetical protein